MEYKNKLDTPIHKCGGILLLVIILLHKEVLETITIERTNRNSAQVMKVCIPSCTEFTVKYVHQVEETDH